MTLETFYIYTQIIGSIAVIISLLFVGFQIREGNKQSRLAAIQGALQLEMEISYCFADHAETWDKVVTGQEILPGPELRKAIVLYNTIMTETEYRFFQYNYGYLEPQSWQGRVNSLRYLLQFPIYKHWRAAPSGHNHSSDFIVFLDKMHSEHFASASPLQEPAQQV